MSLSPRHVAVSTYRVQVVIDDQLLGCMQGGVSPRGGVVPVAVEVEAHKGAPTE